MSKGKGRWPHRDPRHHFPLVGERQDSPRFDGIYRSLDEHLTVRFRADNTMAWSDQPGVWKVDNRELLLTTETLQCSGAVDGESVFLLCTTDGGDCDERVQHELRFDPGD